MYIPRSFRSGLESSLGDEVIVPLLDLKTKPNLSLKTRFDFDETPTADASTPRSRDFENVYGWRSWAFKRIKAQTMSVSPGTNFTHTVTLDLSVGTEKRAGKDTPENQKSMSVVERAGTYMHTPISTCTNITPTHQYNNT